VDLKQCFLDAGLGRERTDALNNFARALAGLDHPVNRLDCVFNVGRLAGQKTTTSVAVGHQSRERLTHFVRDRSGQLTQGYYARDVRKLSLRAMQRLSGARLLELARC